MPAALQQSLAEGLQRLDLRLDRSDQQRLLRYLAVLEKWNRAYNLTAVRDIAEMIPRHLLDSLAVLPYIKGPRVLDIGSGAGFPGIPLAVALPAWHFVLLDSNAKKTRFLVHAAAEMALNNVTVVQGRVEKFHPAEKFDTLVSRAFATIADMLVAAGHLCAAGGSIVAMKGAYPDAELAAIPGEYKVSTVQALLVPGLEAARHVVVITPRSAQ